MILTGLALLTLLLLVTGSIALARGNRQIRNLRETPCLPDLPRVSIIIAARNEERNLAHALESVLRLDYPNLEIIAVNDRSTDATGQILDRLAQNEPRLRPVHVTELPTGWLGKCHALQTGAAAATGEWLLFTDADIVYAPDALRRAVSFAVTGKLDHLAVMPFMSHAGTVLTMFVGAFTLFFAMYARPWRAREPQRPEHIGIGAFNLVRAEAYQRIGGHEPIRLRPDDDLKLGKLIKKNGYRQDIANGNGLVAVEWYSTVPELVRGLEKNSFAGVEYNLLAVIAASVAQLAIIVWPFLALLLTGGVTWWLNLACILVMALLYADNARFHSLPRWHWIAIPFTAVLFQFIIWRATLLTLWRDGIDWRGTHYPLAELKQNKV
jgi:glycosyltransferase involved in cell wall biosynthesis